VFSVLCPLAFLSSLSRGHRIWVRRRLDFDSQEKNMVLTDGGVLRISTESALSVKRILAGVVQKPMKSVIRGTPLTEPRLEYCIDGDNLVLPD